MVPHLVSSGEIVETLVCCTPDGETPAEPPAPPVPAPATVHAHPVGETLVSVHPDQVSYPLSGAHILGYGLAIILDVIVAILAVQGFVTMFPGWPRMAAVVCMAIEASKLILAGLLAARWRTTPWVWRLVLIAIILNAMAISAVGVFDELTTMHLADRGAEAAEVEKRETEIAILVQNQQAVVSDIDRRLGQIDAAVEKPTALGKAKGAMQIVEDQRKPRATLVEDRKRATDGLTALQMQQAQVKAQAHQIESAALPLRYAALALGIDVDDERLMRWLCLMILVGLDAAAISVAAVVSTWKGSGN